MSYRDQFYADILAKRGMRNDRWWIWNPLARQALRFIPFRLDTRALLASQFWSREQIESLQQTRLLGTIRAASSIPFWAERFAKIADQPADVAKRFEQIPITLKSDLTDVDAVRITDSAYRKISYWDQTSGSTGRPFSFLVDHAYLLRSYATCERMFRVAGHGVRLPVLSMRARKRGGFAYKNWTFFFVRGYNSLRHRLTDFQIAAARYPDGFILYGFVSPIIELARLMHEYDLSLPIRAVITSGEELAPNARRAIEENLATEVFTCYTTQELGWLGFECEHHRLHLNEESALIEIVDAAGNRCAPGTEGRVVVTPFDHRAMPLIRYFTGDTGTIAHDVCPCGRTLQTIKLKGREAHMLSLGDSRRVPLLEISAIFDSFFSAVRQYQIKQTGSFDFTIRVVPGTHFERDRTALHDRLQRHLHPRVNITWEEVSEIESAPSSKAIYFVKVPSV